MIEQLLPGQVTLIVIVNVIVNVIVIQVTLVFNRSEQLNNKLNPDTDLVGVRIPDHDFLREV